MGYFLLFYLPEKWKIKKNEKNTWRYHHFTQVYQKSWSYGILFEKWQVTDVIVIFHFGVFFALLLAWKMKISQKWKNCLEISSFYTSVPQLTIIWYTVPEIWQVTDVIVIFHFGLFFALLPRPPSPPPWLAWKIKNFKKFKNLDLKI